MTITTESPPIGELLKSWRNRRRKSQLELGIEAEVSTRHLSFLETGRAMPSREMVLRLAEHLSVPLRDRNRLLMAAGYAPVYRERTVDAPEMALVRQALDKVLAGHEPYPAVVVDREWNMVAGNGAIGLFLEGVAAHLLEPPVNVIRLALHPEGLAPRLINHGQVRDHMVHRIRRHADLTGDARLGDLHDELAAYPHPETGHVPPGSADILLPIKLRYGGAVLELFSTIATFGTALDITLAELAIEAFWPANEASAAAMRAQGSP